MSSAASEITVFSKEDGPLTKLISLTADGSVKSDGSACVMSSGAARRVPIADVEELAALIGGLEPNQAIALGALRAGLLNKVRVVTKARLNGEACNVIARTGDNIIYRNEQPAFALLDYDTKAMPDEIAAKIERGGFWKTLLTVLPELANVARVTRSSTSAGLFRSDTGEKLPGSSGLHVYLMVRDGIDAVRFLKALHERCWLAGLGWMMIGAGGQLLERSIVDRMVGAPERLVFEGGPILEPPLAQDCNSRRPIADAGIALDTAAACPPLTIVEKSRLDELRAKEAHRLATDAAKVRGAYIERKAGDVAERTGVAMAAARRVIERQCGGTLLPDVVLPFDDEAFAGCTVADVLADPDHFAGATLADPIGGVDYGACVAKILRRADGTPWIHSFAHGRAVYELKYDAAAVRGAIEAADEAAAAKLLRDLCVTADLEPEELEELRDVAHQRSKTNKRTIDAMLKAAKREHAAVQAKQEHERRIAERADPRPQIDNPDEDAPWIEQMDILGDVLGAASTAMPPARDIDDEVSQVQKMRIPGTHAFTQASANAEPEEEN
jgi:hypothetical protein